MAQIHVPNLFMELVVATLDHEIYSQFLRWVMREVLHRIFTTEFCGRRLQEFGGSAGVSCTLEILRNEKGPRFLEGLSA